MQKQKKVIAFSPLGYGFIDLPTYLDNIRMYADVHAASNSRISLKESNAW